MNEVLIEEVGIDVRIISLEVELNSIRCELDKEYNESLDMIENELVDSLNELYIERSFS